MLEGSFEGISSSGWKGRSSQLESEEISYETACRSDISNVAPLPSATYTSGMKQKTGKISEIIFYSQICCRCQFAAKQIRCE